MIYSNERGSIIDAEIDLKSNQLTIEKLMDLSDKLTRFNRQKRKNKKNGFIINNLHV